LVGVIALTLLLTVLLCVTATTRPHFSPLLYQSKFQYTGQRIVFSIFCFFAQIKASKIKNKMKKQKVSHPFTSVRPSAVMSKAGLITNFSEFFHIEFVLTIGRLNKFISCLTKVTSLNIAITPLSFCCKRITLEDFMHPLRKQTILYYAVFLTVICTDITYYICHILFYFTIYFNNFNSSLRFQKMHQNLPKSMHQC
jgi:hypothetical protein